MRILLCVLAMALLPTAYAQDYCKAIKKEVSPDNKIFDYNSPFNPEDVTAIKVSRSINVDPDYESDNFVMIFQVEGDLESIYTKSQEGEQVEKDEQKLVIEFADKSKISDDTLKVSHDFTSDRLRSIRIIYMPVTDANIKDLTTKKITKFSVAGFERSITDAEATAVMNYVACIKKAR